jgi:hypothetical protein
VVIGFGLVIAFAAAARSTWSPCGLSMLSQITPLAEAGRGQRFSRTAAWFILGATVGGLTLGGAMAVGAAGFAASGLGSTAAGAVLSVGALAAAAVDARVFGNGGPFLCRQVNDAWLSQYRPWVYGGGFGWQIGVGVTTYVMTAAVPLLIVVGVLTASPEAALGLGVAFGFLRGCAVLLGARIRTPNALYAAHRHVDALTQPVRAAVIAVLLGVAAAAAWIATYPLVAVVISAGAVALAARLRPSRRVAPRDRLAAPTLPTGSR